ncbi:uncharacterized protein LOC124170822 isoform X2 [Ischnura elegans]|uniref:uncharacterized protein LOC124170822 isoform X2 n=1 Tax=Ischnura elegans TaxID=197161 RepID=UPI001ED8765A|nr:uncharacterized protein LOC124170822 isoform X2 [Ischnura elegans]
MKEERERPPLRVILQNFINHVENLETYRRENSYEKEFQDLKLFSENLKTVGEYSCREGEKEINRKKNRYKDILPFDYTRVTLSEYVGVPGSDYINANYIKGASGSPAYIASQGPLPHTVNDFWRMVVECEVQVIVMACNEEESGKHKCENYWVEKEGEEKKFGMATIRLLKASTICPDFLVRTMQLKYMNAQSIIEERVVCQFHYGAWPDHGVPGLVRPLLDMVRLVRDTQASETLPVLVHCSAGCGRTGTICAIDYVWGLLRAGKLKLDFSLFQLVRDMRKQRIAMVQTKDQYILVHQAVKELFQDQLRMINSHPYENIDIRGLPIVPILSSKAAILYPGQSSPLEEKQDSREKESSITSSSVSTEEAVAITMPGVSDAPPLPHKKRIHAISSKQEKEVENLTQRQLAMASACGKVCQQPFPGKLLGANDLDTIEQSEKILSSAKRVPTPAPLTATMSDCAFGLPRTSSSGQEDCGEVQKPSIARLKALFESNSGVREVKQMNAGSILAKPRCPQGVTRSHSLGAVRKPQKFSQFTASGASEEEVQPPLSSDLSESERFKSASNNHVDRSCSIYQGPEVNVDSFPVEREGVEDLKRSVFCDPKASLYCEMKSRDQATNVPIIQRKPVPDSFMLSPLLKNKNSSKSSVELPPVSHVSLEPLRPALPIKRSKSLKAKMSGETFKLSLSKKDAVQTQDLPAEGVASSAHPPCIAERKSESLSKASRGYDIFVPAGDNFSKDNMPLKVRSISSTKPVKLTDTSISSTKRTDVREACSAKVSINSGAPNPEVGLPSVSSANKSGSDTEQFPRSLEGKRTDQMVKPNCDVCRAQNFNLRREKSFHALKAFSQDVQYSDLKKFDVTDSTKLVKEPFKYKSIPDKIGGAKTLLQKQKSLQIDSSKVYDHSTKYLMAEGMENSDSGDCQRSAAVSARHKVDTVVGGLGIRERRNSFRRAVGQSVDDKSSSIKTSKVNKWPPSSNESYSLSHPDGGPLKKQFENQPTSSQVICGESLPVRELSESNKAGDGNVTTKSPPGVQKLPIVSKCKYLKGVPKTSENFCEASELQKQKVLKMPETLPSPSDLAHKSLRSTKITVSDSNSFQPSSTPWMHSVASGDSKVLHNPANPRSPNSNDALSPLKRSTTNNEARPWPTQLYSNVPLDKGKVSDAPCPVDMLGSQINSNIVVPLEVDVDQVGASMNFQGKSEVGKTVNVPDNPNPGNSGASAHFTRALEVFQQTAASIRTKFSWSGGTGSTSPKSSETSPKASVSPSQRQSPKVRPNGVLKKGERSIPSVSDQPKVLKKQQQYL